MDNYEIYGYLGAGSFGRVYRAKNKESGEFVAMKVISKRGRSAKELKGFRRECEIQRQLHHPNIIQMLDSFETENEIVVITEYAHNELNELLGKKGFLPEENVQIIVWDLVSALHYLHFKRVLHRDLKPQNILLDSQNRAKLCDFGFARNMSTGTHVLTSIKGTPLYMAPELIIEQPYDYTADLWSLGCIIYELLMGTPPFCTTSILHLIRLIKHKEIEWPTFLSENCISFLKGLLQKNPEKRFTWDKILAHPFVEGHILLSEEAAEMPLTQPLSHEVTIAKEKQRKESQKQTKSKGIPKLTNSGGSGTTKKSREATKNPQIKSSESPKKELEDKTDKEKLTIIEDLQPIDTEEWIYFLQKSIQEILSGELSCLTQPLELNVLVAPLRNQNANTKVVTFVTKLLSLPFSLKDISEDSSNEILKVYLELKIVPNLVYSLKLLMKLKSNESVESSLEETPVKYRNLSDLNEEDFEVFRTVYLLITHLVYLDDKHLLQLCDALVVLNVFSVVKDLLLISKEQSSLVSDVLAVLTQIARQCPENSDILDKILKDEEEIPGKKINFAELLRHDDAQLRERMCYFILVAFKSLPESTTKQYWNEEVKETLEALVYDSIEFVRNAAEIAVEELKAKEFYEIYE